MPRTADDFEAIRRRLGEIKRPDPDGALFQVSVSFAIHGEHLETMQQPAIPIEWGWAE